MVLRGCLAARIGVTNPKRFGIAVLTRRSSVSLEFWKLTRDTENWNFHGYKIAKWLVTLYWRGSYSLGYSGYKIGFFRCNQKTRNQGRSSRPVT